MPRLSNISIGVKLGVMSGLGIALVATMIVASMYGSSDIEASSREALLQQGIETDLARVELGFTNARLSVRNIRLTDNKEDLEKANNLPAIKRDAGGALETLIGEIPSPEKRATLEKIKRNLDQFVDTAIKEIVPVQIRMQAYDSSAFTLISDLTAKMNKVQSERMDPAFMGGIALVKELAVAAKKASQQEAQNAERSMRSASQINVALGVAVVLILIGSAFVGVMTIARPMKALVHPLESVADGNFAVQVPGADRMDEVGQIAQAVALMAQKVSQTIGEIKASGREVTNASAEIATSTTDLSKRTEEQAASIEETSAAMEQLSATVRKNAENAQIANTDANATRDVADRGGQVVAKAVVAMAKIEESSRKISDIIGVIDEIARQTNLLALNAAVEAARAGEAGRGFAVVASEVRSLAQRSSQAAKDIKDLITNSNGQVKEGVELVNKAGGSLTEIVESIKKVAVVVADIANASIEQATGIEQINKALTQMDEATQQNSALVEENAATAKTLEHQAKAMDEQVAYFRIANPEMAAEPQPAATPARQAAPPRESTDTPPRQAAA